MDSLEYYKVFIFISLFVLLKCGENAVINHFPRLHTHSFDTNVKCSVLLGMSPFKIQSTHLLQRNLLGSWQLMKPKNIGVHQACKHSGKIKDHSGTPLNILQLPLKSSSQDLMLVKHIAQAIKHSKLVSQMSCLKQALKLKFQTAGTRIKITVLYKEIG